jgi:hypothetical protein
MNANEIADELNGRLDHKAANMILKQQAEIESLRNNGYKTHYELLRLEFIEQKSEIEALKERNQFLECFYRTVKAGAK